MRTKPSFAKLASPFLLATLAAVSGTALAASGTYTPGKASATVESSGPVNQTPAPPDCKKNPTDPRCKDK